jgi:hypothetical protein
MTDASWGVVCLTAQQGVAIDWKAHARLGLPVTLLALAVVAGWLRWGF